MATDCGFSIDSAYLRPESGQIPAAPLVLALPVSATWATETHILIRLHFEKHGSRGEPARKGSRRARYRKFGFSIRLLLGRV